MPKNMRIQRYVLDIDSLIIFSTNTQTDSSAFLYSLSESSRIGEVYCINIILDEKNNTS